MCVTLPLITLRMITPVLNKSATFVNVFLQFRSDLLPRYAVNTFLFVTAIYTDIKHLFATQHAGISCTSVADPKGKRTLARN